MADELKDQRVVTMMSPGELQGIDDWAFANRIRSRGEAIRRLTKIGLASDSGRDEIVENMNKAVAGFWTMMMLFDKYPDEAKSETRLFRMLVNMYEQTTENLIRVNEILLRTFYAAGGNRGHFPFENTDEAVRLLRQAAEDRHDEDKFKQTMEQLEALFRERRKRGQKAFAEQKTEPSE